MNKIRKGDNIIVLSGKEKGRSGIVLSVDNQNHKVLVENLNLFKKHTKPNPSKATVGGINTKIMPIHISNVSLIDNKGLPSKVGVKFKNGKKSRFLKTTNIILTT